MGDFEQRVERFCKQFRSCLGIEPDLRASFHSEKKFEIFGQGNGFYHQIIESPILPVFYSDELTKKLNSTGGGNMTSDQLRQDLFKKWEVDPKYKVNTEVIQIKKAMDSEGLEEYKALLIIDDYTLEHWGEDTFKDRHDILLTDNDIWDSLRNWVKERETQGLETPNFDTAQMMLIDDLYEQRAKYYYRLIRSIKEEPIVEKANYVIYGKGPKFYIPIDEPTEDRPQPNIEESEVKEGFKTADFVNNFDGKTWDAVHNHFDEKLRAKGFVSKEVLDKFIVEAFQYQNPPKVKKVFLTTSEKRGTIINAFFQYKSLYKVKKRKKDDYVKLLTDYFEGFDHQSTWHAFKEKK